MEKMKKTAKVIYKLLGVAFWLIVVCAALVTVVSLIMGFSGEKTFVDANGNFGIDLGGVSIALGNGAPVAAEMRSFWFVGAAMTAVAAAGCAYGLYVLRGIIRPMMDGRPFDESVSSDLKKLAWLCIICGIVFNICGVLSEIMIADALAISGIAEQFGVTVQNELNLTFFIAALFCFLFSFVFRYGHELQELSDETL